MATRHRFRSGFERQIARQLDRNRMPYEYEKHKFDYVLKTKRYTPDFFITKGGFFVEVKGRLSTADRVKSLCVKNQHPNIDLRFVFLKAGNQISKDSRTTYGTWADKHSFKWAEGAIPKAWLKERKVK